MQYRVGQRVRLLHESGEGVIVELVDKFHVEVDMGDDFPIDVHVDEIIAIDHTETAYLKSDDDSKSNETKARTIQTLGTSILDLSMVVIPGTEGQYELHVVNPEPSDALFTAYTKSGNKYTGLASGILASGERYKFQTIDLADLNKTKSFFFQILLFLPGKGYPHAPLQKELQWSKARLQAPPKMLKPFKKEGWVFNLRDDKQMLDVKAIQASEFIKVREVDIPSERKEVEVDLHIEELVKRPDRLAPSEIIQIQLEHFQKKYDEAIMNHHGSLIVIHGVGLGILKKEVHKLLKGKPEVKEFLPADPGKYGNGATKVVFK
ncbi:MAG: Smr/MutS family protein [Bacteroidota bacterium]